MRMFSVVVAFSLVLGCGSSEEDHVAIAREPDAPAEPETDRIPPAPTAPAVPEAPAPVPAPPAPAGGPDPEPPPPNVELPPVGEDDDAAEDPYVPADPALRFAPRIGTGPSASDLLTAAGIGLISPEGDDEDGTAQLEASVDYRARTYVLFRAPGGLPEYAGARGSPRISEPARFAVWLAELARAGTDPVSYRRIAAVRLHDLAAPSDRSDAECTVTSELRGRDLDGDGGVEITAIVAAAAVPLDDNESCGAMAFLVHGDGLRVQASFTREYRYFHTGADGDTSFEDQTTWQVRDLNGDGHADLHVTERWRFTDDFEGDDDGEGGTIPGSHSRGGDRREVDCLWDAATDTWPCPEASGARLGATLLREPSLVIASSRDAFIRPW